MLNDPSRIPPLLEPPPDVPRRRRRRNKLGEAIGAGVLSAVGGSVVWAVLVGLTGYRLGILAIGIGTLVGFCVRTYGRGRTEVFGVIAMLCAAFGCLLGDILGGAALISIAQDVSVLRVLDNLTLDLVRILLYEMVTFIDFVFYVIAMIAAYKAAILTE
jgi:hypothetical protein